MKVREISIEILPLTHSTKYLGQQLMFSDAVDQEMDNRIRAGWAKFHQHKQELTNRRYDLYDCLRLFQATLTPTVLYACPTWTLMKQLEAKLRRAQRRMLRMIMQTLRRIRQSNTKASTSSDSDVSSDIGL